MQQGRAGFGNGLPVSNNGHKSRRAICLANSDIFQTQIWDFELAQPNIYSINELMEYMKGPASPTNPKLQDLHGTGQEQDIWEES